MDLHSSAAEKGKTVTQIIHFINGEKRTVEGVMSNTIKQGQFTKFKTTKGHLVMVNDKNVLMIEIFPEHE